MSAARLLVFFCLDWTGSETCEHARTLAVGDTKQEVQFVSSALKADGVRV